MAIRQEGNTYYGLSTDTKPTGAVLNGREFREMDTGKTYLFDEENGEWLEQPEEGGGGGGGSTTLSGLTDVDISNPSNGQTLVYNASAGKWENGAGGGGGTPDMIILTTDYTGMWTGATYSIIAGSYSALRAKLVAHNPAVVCLCVEQSGDGFSSYTEYVPFLVTLGVGAEEDYYIGMKFTDESFEAFELNAFPDGTVSART